MKIYDGEPPEDDEDEVAQYAGKCLRIWIQGQEMDIISFPGWYHMVVLGDDSLERCLSEDLREGMAIQVGGNVGLIDKIEEGLYCGKVDGVFLGEMQDEDDVVLRKEFVREVFKDGKLNWRCLGPTEKKRGSICPSCGRPLEGE
jgi:hypothetical protein